MMISTLLSWYDLKWLKTQFLNEMIRLVILFHVNISSLKQGSHFFSFPSLQSIAAPHSAQLWIDTTSSLQLGSTHAIHTIDTQTNKYNKHTNKVVEVEGILSPFQIYKGYKAQPNLFNNKKMMRSHLKASIGEMWESGALECHQTGAVGGQRHEALTISIWFWFLIRCKLCEWFNHFLMIMFSDPNHRTWSVRCEQLETQTLRRPGHLSANSIIPLAILSLFLVRMLIMVIMVISMTIWLDVISLRWSLVHQCLKVQCYPDAKTFIHDVPTPLEVDLL